jgi:transposase
MRLFGGIDWASRTHTVCIVDEAGAVVARFEIAHSGAGLSELRRRLESRRRGSELAIAIERPSGTLVDVLIDAGFVVVPIHPNVVQASRPRYRAAGGKSDPGDAYILADLLRTDGHRFRPLVPQSDETRALRALVRGRDDLVATRVQLANQLTSLLEGFWPGAAAIFADIESPIALAFVQKFPTPESAKHLGEKRLATFLARHAYSGRRSPVELLHRLRTAPECPVGDAEADAKGEVARHLAACLAGIVRRLQLLTADVEHAVSTHSDGPIVMSFPRAGRVNAAQILAELGDDRSRFRSPDQLASEAGCAPVTHASGKHRGVGFRWACNKRLRTALTTFADNSRRSSPWAAAVYDQARARGCHHPHAVRILAKAWLRVLWACWQARQAYDPAKHRGAGRLAA